MTSQFVGNITKTKQKETYTETIGHDKVTETYLLKYFNIVANLPLIKLFKIKCFLVNLLRKNYQLCLTWHYITHNVNIHNLDEGIA